VSVGWGEVHDVVHVLERKFKVPTHTLRWQRPGGCAHCQGRGTKGKTLVAEMVRPDRAWLMHIKAGDDDGALQHHRASSDGFLQSANMTGKTVFEHTLFKALAGLVDPRNCEEFDSFARFELMAPKALKLATLGDRV
jgi:general secretion pathway protein E